MEMSETDVSILEALARIDPDRGEHVSARLLAENLPEIAEADLAEALRELAARQFVQIDPEGCATITELGAAAVRSM